MAEFMRVIKGPVTVDGGILRLVELSDGSGPCRNLVAP